MALFSPLQLLATYNGRAPYYQRSSREAAAWEGAATPLSTEFRTRNHAALGHIDLVVGYGRSGVPFSSHRLRHRVPTGL